MKRCVVRVLRHDVTLLLNSRQPKPTKPVARCVDVFFSGPLHSAVRRANLGIEPLNSRLTIKTLP